MLVVCSLLGVLTLLAGVGGARPARRADAVSIAMLTNVTSKPGWDVMIANFERVYPNIRVDITYAPSQTFLFQIELTELAAGSAPDLLATNAGCGTPIAVCVLGKAGYLAPMVNKPWAKSRSLPLVTSFTKYRRALVAFQAQVDPFGIFTNDSLFRRLGLTIPRTFSQLLDVCRRAKDAGTPAVILAGGSPQPVTGLLSSLAVATVYGMDKHWNQQLDAGKATFDGSSGWHLALQRFIDMNGAGCFQPGATGVSSGTAGAALFAQGKGLMFPLTSNNDGTIAAADPQFSYSFHPFPGGTSPTQTTTLMSLTSPAVSVNAHASARNQAAAQKFVDFVARPKQDSLFTHITGGLTQYELVKRQLPTFMSSLETVFAKQRWVISPTAGWWNASILVAMQANEIGLITGQRSIDDVLKAMDAAWKQGPA